MKKLLLFVSVISLLPISCKKDVVKQTKTVIKTKTAVLHTDKLTWKGFKPTGSHFGNINIKENNLKFNDNNISGNVVFDMSTVKCIDLKDPKYNADLVAHLKSKDFFNIEKYPTAKFEITNCASDKTGTYQLEGNLTIKDITKNIKFSANTKTNTNGAVILKSNTIKIDRTDYGIKYKSKKFFDNLKDKFINDVFNVSFRLKVKK